MPSRKPRQKLLWPLPHTLPAKVAVDDYRIIQVGFLFAHFNPVRIIKKSRVERLSCSGKSRCGKAPPRSGRLLRALREVSSPRLEQGLLPDSPALLAERGQCTTLAGVQARPFGQDDDSTLTCRVKLRIVNSFARWDSSGSMVRVWLVQG